MALLVSIEDNQKYPLTEAESRLGRHPDCEVQIEAGAVSRYHARITQHDGKWFIADLGSRNYTFLNRHQLIAEKDYEINNGDTVTICDVDYRFSLSDDGKTNVVLEQREDAVSTIMSSLDVSSLSSGGIQLAAKPETKLRALLNISQTLGGALALDDVLPKVIDSLFTIFLQADRGIIVMKEKDGSLVPRWHKTRRDDSWETIRISKTIVQEVMTTKKAILSADAAEDVRFGMSQSIADFRIRSMMCCPLFDANGDVFGVIQVDTMEQGRKFKDEDLEILASVAAEAGNAIDRATMHQQALRQQEIEKDLEVARDVQKGFLPDRRPDVPGYSFYDYYEPMDQVGGDYYDYILLPNGRFAVIVADVVGHGVQAALLMAKLSAEARFCLATISDPGVALTTLNTKMARLNIQRFVTVVITVIDPENHRGYVANAGHMAPIHRTADGKTVEEGESAKGLPIMIVDEMEYGQHEFSIEPGEMLVMYTDGVNEAMNASDEQFGIDRIHQVVIKEKDTNAVGEHIIKSVRQFLGTASQDDDMCLVCVGREA